MSTLIEWTLEEEAEVLRRIALGESVTDVARATRISTNRIYIFLRQRKVHYVYQHTRRERFDKESAFIREQMQAGTSRREIARQLKFTMQRLNRRVFVMGLASPDGAAQAMTERGIRQRVLRPKFDPLPLPEVDRTGEPESKRLSLVDLEPGQCKYVHGDPRVGDHHYCGHDTVAPKQYCAFHWNMCYEVPKILSGDTDGSRTPATGLAVPEPV